MTTVLQAKFAWSADDVDAAMLQLAGLVCPTETLDIIPNDPDDNRVLESAVTAGSQFIVSGDHHR